jgi:hypothetical protein
MCLLIVEYHRRMIWIEYLVKVYGQHHHQFQMFPERRKQLGIRVAARDDCPMKNRVALGQNVAAHFRV